jgi:hypothetical protein
MTTTREMKMSRKMDIRHTKNAYEQTDNGNGLCDTTENPSININV